MMLLKHGSQLLLCLAVTYFAYPQQLAAQQKKANSKAGIKKAVSQFPTLSTTHIAGAPDLGQPQLITCATGPVMGEGNGWAAPAFWDYTGDGKKDLLIGEFASGVETKGMSIGNFVRVYTNEGTDQQPAFGYDFSYVKGEENSSRGTPLSVYTWCCFPFTPRIADLDADGFPDILTGQYNPGFVTWFRGSADGFMPGQTLQEEGHAVTSVLNRFNYEAPVTDISAPPYWNYSSVAFGDMDGDGDLDMVVGGAGLRLCENVGSKSVPLFGRRNLLLDTAGNPLTIAIVPSSEKDTFNVFRKNYTALSSNTVPYVDDWDNDGVPDLLVTECYVTPGTAAITFFKGVMTAKGIRFYPGVSLLKVSNGAKELPGSWPNICVADWNNDGVKDLLIGLSVPTINGVFNPELAWSWEYLTGIIKLSPAYYDINFKMQIEENMRRAKAFKDSTGMSTEELRAKGYSIAEDTFKHAYLKEEYKQLSHRGYVYVMLGKNSALKKTGNDATR
jgi:hypothetical protein